MRTLRHPNPYYLRWIFDTRDLKVTKKVPISFSIGKYKNKVLCDVILMHACHIILGRPWQFDCQVTYDGYKNQYAFTWKNKQLILAPSKPSKAYEDQMRITRECKTREKEKSAHKEQNKSETKYTSVQEKMEDLSGEKEKKKRDRLWLGKIKEQMFLLIKVRLRVHY